MIHPLPDPGISGPGTFGTVHGAARGRYNLLRGLARQARQAQARGRARTVCNIDGVEAKKARAKVAPTMDRETLRGFVRDGVVEGMTVYANDASAWSGKNDIDL